MQWAVFIQALGIRTHFHKVNNETEGEKKTLSNSSSKMFNQPETDKPSCLNMCDHHFSKNVVVALMCV